MQAGGHRAGRGARCCSCSARSSRAARAAGCWPVTAGPGRLAGRRGRAVRRRVVAVTLAWLFAWPYVLPWYDGLGWAALALLPWSRLDGLLLARTAALALGYLPGRGCYPGAPACAGGAAVRRAWAGWRPWSGPRSRPADPAGRLVALMVTAWPGRTRDWRRRRLGRAQPDLDIQVRARGGGSCWPSSPPGGPRGTCPAAGRGASAPAGRARPSAVRTASSGCRGTGPPASRPAGPARPAARLAGHRVLGERQRQPLQFLDELGREAVLQLLDRALVDLLQPGAALLVQRRGPDLLQELADHVARRA